MARHPSALHAGFALLFSASAIWIDGSAFAAGAKRHGMRIGFITDGRRDAGESLEDLYAKAISDVVKGDTELEITLPKDKRRVGDWTPQGVHAEIDRLFNDADVDVIVALGWLSSNDLAQRATLPKPCYAVYIIDAELQGLEKGGKTKRKNNLAFIVSPGVLKSDLDGFHRLVAMHKLAILTSRAALDAIPRFSEGLVARAREAGVDATVIAINRGDVEAALSAIPSDAYGAYVLLADDLNADAFQRLQRGLIARKMPSFSMRGRPEVEAGLMATLVAKPEESQRARRVAVNMLRLAANEEPSSFPSALARTEGLLINMATARAVGFAPTWDVLTEAEQLNAGGGQQEASRKVTMRSAAEDAIKANLDLEVDRDKAEAGKNKVAKARSLLLPSVDVSLTGAIVDEQRAAASLGFQAERSLSGEVVVKQVIWAERAWANLSIQSDIQMTREQKTEILKLDTALEAAKAYVNVLRAETLAKIRIDNLKKSRSNLDLARVRSSVGSGGPAEVYRWEVQIATDRREVINADSIHHAAMIQLNRMLHRPLEEPFITVATNLDGEELVVTPKKLSQFVDNPALFNTFREFMVEEALARAPELKALDAAIAAQERGVTSTKMSLFVPDVGFEGRFKDVLLQGGAGSEPPHIPGFLHQLLPIGVRTSNFTWSVGVGLQFKLFAGLGDWAEMEKAEADLTRRKAERAAAAEKIEQRMRTYLHIAGGSYPGVRLAREGAEAAKKALDIVSSAYAEGAIGVIDLLDAQNGALITDQLAVNASYDFILDQLNVQRAVGWLAFMEPGSAEEFLQRIRTYYQQHPSNTKE